MPAFMIGPEERAKIAKLIAHAQANGPLHAETLMAMDPDTVRDMMLAFSINLPVGYTVTYSIEAQPSGLFHHLSMAVDRPRRLPSHAAVDMVLEEFRMRPLRETPGNRIWVERIDEERSAVNVAQPLRAGDA